MPKITQLNISAGRKAVVRYCTREVNYGVVIELEEGDDARQTLETWTRKLQFLCDQELGDMHGPDSFQTTKKNGISPCGDSPPVRSS